MSKCTLPQSSQVKPLIMFDYTACLDQYSSVPKTPIIPPWYLLADTI